jgi:hypothetical protein
MLCAANNSWFSNFSACTHALATHHQHLTADAATWHNKQLSLANILYLVQ